ncbi:hypothetical protein [Anianabacter salinae]|uniref:hypothetical protein n=1 Tax=Anianabacter salinae TaxID=2851023 RepID=UPI00225E03B5|nr:hypothetical protein [Anianabacter salinae]MBV0913401.1 hypothetical protein [Anianabacter salinae]
MGKYGPGRGEILFRLVFSLAGLVFMAVAFVLVGLPQGPAFAEVGIIAGGFFLGTAIWSARALMRAAPDTGSDGGSGATQAQGKDDGGGAAHHEIDAK